MGSLPLYILLIGGGGDTPRPTDQQQLVPTSTSVPASGIPASSQADPTNSPITAEGRLIWGIKSTIGPGSLFVGAVQAGWGNLTDRPPEYREGMEGFGKRFGLRLTSVGTSNLMEASLGAIWSEDPRYKLSHDKTTAGRFSQALKMTFMAERADGHVAPAYARYIAYSASNAVSDAWRPDSQRNVSSTATRIGERFLGRFIGNLFKEYWPSIRQHTFLKHNG